MMNGNRMKRALAYGLIAWLMIGQPPAYAKYATQLSADVVHSRETDISASSQMQHRDSARGTSNALHGPLAKGFLWITPLPSRKKGYTVEYEGKWWVINYAIGETWGNLANSRIVARLPVELKFPYGLRTVQSPEFFQRDGSYALLFMAEIPINAAQPFEDVYSITMKRSATRVRSIASFSVSAGGVFTKNYVLPDFFVWVQKMPTANGSGTQEAAHIWQLSTNRTGVISLSASSEGSLWPRVTIRSRKIEFEIGNKEVASYTF